MLCGQQKHHSPEDDKYILKPQGNNNSIQIVGFVLKMCTSIQITEQLVARLVFFVSTNVRVQINTYVSLRSLQYFITLL